MKVTHFYGNNSQAARGMQYDAVNSKPSLYDKYVTPSYAKIESFERIRKSYLMNDTTILGIPCKTLLVPKSLHKLNNVMYARYINGTLGVASASSHFYITTALFEDVETNKRYIIKETHCNTYMCEM